MVTSEGGQSCKKLLHMLEQKLQKAANVQKKILTEETPIKETQEKAETFGPHIFAKADRGWRTIKWMVRGLRCAWISMNLVNEIE